MPDETVERLIYTSESCVGESVFTEMLRIRDHCLVRNAADGVQVALLYQGGWFMQWIEGPAAGVRAVVQRVRGDPRHRNLRIMHVSSGEPRLRTPWSGAYWPGEMFPGGFGHRVLEMAAGAGPSLEPAAVWRRLSMPLKGLQAKGAAGDHYQRVMVCSARGTQSFELIHWLGEAHRSTVMRQRLAGARPGAPDVGSDYVDLDWQGGAALRRVVAHARQGLQIGLVRAFVPDYSHVVLLLCGSGHADADLVDILVSACARLPQRPVLIGVAGPGCDHAGLRAAARAGGLAYIDCEVGAVQSAQALWAAAEPALDLSRRV